MAIGAPYSTATRMDEQTADAVSITGGSINGVTIGSGSTISGASLNLTGNETVGGTLAVTGASTLTGAITGGATLNLTGAETVGGTLVVTGASTLTGTATLPDGATWGATGLADSASYTTSSTAIVNLAPTWNFSSTSNGIGPISIVPVLTPTGATAGNLNANTLSTALANSAVNVATLRGISAGATISANYSATVTAGIGVLVSFVNSGTNAVGTTTLVSLNPQTNGNGITTGSVTNLGLDAPAFTAAAGVGGTVANTAIRVSVPSSSAAGNTDRAIHITGNGGAASTKYALYSDSTAPSSLAGSLSLPTGTSIAAAGTTRADATQLTSMFNNVTTVAGSTGVILPASQVGVHVYVSNAGGSAAKVYAPGSDSIDGTAGSTGVTLTNSKRCMYYCVATNTYVSAQMGVASA